MTAEYESALDKLRDAHNETLREFQRYFINNWKFEGKEQWQKDYAEPYPGDDWIKGYNTGIEAIAQALDCYLEENTY